MSEASPSSPTVIPKKFVALLLICSFASIYGNGCNSDASLFAAVTWDFRIFGSYVPSAGVVSVIYMLLTIISNGFIFWTLNNYICFNLY